MLLDADTPEICPGQISPDIPFFHSQTWWFLMFARRLQLPKTSCSPDGNVVLVSRVMINIGMETTDTNSKLYLIKVLKILTECLPTLTTYHVLGHVKMSKKDLLGVSYRLGCHLTLQGDAAVRVFCFLTLMHLTRRV